MKVKAEARLDLLRQAGVAVETWLKSAMNQVMEELENERWNNLNTHDPSLSVRPQTCLIQAKLNVFVYCYRNGAKKLLVEFFVLN